MIRSLLTLTAAATISLLLVACSESDPATANKPDRPPPAAPVQAPGPDVADQSQTGQAPAGGGRSGGN